ncbi:MAG: response regulator transcription factor [Bacteroidia bacterium]|nr:response regulator transcription factor [Bacteroidia bacterium]
MSQLQPNILLVEDDLNLGNILREYLEMKDFEVSLERDGEAGLSSFQTGTWDLCILDVMMPKLDGFSLAREIRRVDVQTPILFLTAKSMLEDKMEGFSLGGDDYLTKPFSMEELVMRIKALLRRRSTGSEPGEANENEFSLGKYTFHYPERRLDYPEKSFKLTTKEAELLRLLCLHQSKVLKRETALRLIWGDDSYFNGRSMDVFITKLRKHLRHDPRISILNVHGTGFKLLVEE